MSIRCPTCDTENAENSAFCIECGAALRTVAVGSTERLLQAGDGKRCQFCDTANPSPARFCVNCGRSLAATALPTASVTRPTYTPPIEPAALAAPRSYGTNRFAGRNKAVWGGVSGGMFLIGLAILFATSTFWPGILVLVGLMAFIGATIGGEPRGGIIGAFWMLGLAVLFATDTFWPGILVLVGLSAIVGTLLGTFQRRPGR